MSEWSTLKEIAVQYRTGAEPFRVKREALRQELKDSKDKDEVQILRRRIKDLTRIIDEMEMMADCADRYYDPGYYRDDQITCNCLRDNNHPLEDGASAYQSGTDDNMPTGYATHDYGRAAVTSRKKSAAKPDPLSKLKQAFKF